MNKLEAIRKACIEANPEIVELKFGCKTAEYSDKTDIYVGKNEIENEYYFISLDKIGCEDYQFFVEGLPQPKIIGRDIRLADVLLAIRGNHVGIQSNGCFIQLTPGDPVGKYELSQKYDRFSSMHETYEWNLLKDSLNDQPPETIDFIYSLIEKK